MSLESFESLERVLREISIEKATYEHNGYGCTVSSNRVPGGTEYKLTCEPVGQTVPQNTENMLMPTELVMLAAGISVAVAGIYWLRHQYNIQTTKPKNTSQSRNANQSIKETGEILNLGTTGN